MSFDLAVWRENGPVTAATALQIYEQLCEGLPDVVEPDRRVVAFHRELTDRFPDMATSTTRPSIPHRGPESTTVRLVMCS
jgi:hypothetical protein